MAEDWLADVRRYDADADEDVVAKIVRHCGIALRNRDSSLVSFSDSKETDRVRNNFLKKKLGLKEPKAALDAAIAEVGERMKADRNKNRVTVYYLLADHFGKLDVFGGAKRAAGAAAAAAAGAATAAAATSGAAASGGGAATKAAHLTGGHGGSGGDDFDLLSFGCLALAVILGGVLLAMVASGWIFGESEEEAPAAPPAATAPAEAPAAAETPAIPEGAGVIAAQRDAKPMLTVYFDTGKADVSPEFQAASAELLAYLEANPEAKLAISGFNDPTGDAALNAELSKNRAQAVQAALVAAGVDEAKTDLVKPDDTTREELSNEEARRVEITIVE